MSSNPSNQQVKSNQRVKQYGILIALGAAIMIVAVLGFFAYHYYLGQDQGPEGLAGQSIQTTMGILPPQTDTLIQEEYKVYRDQHPEMDETEARRAFDTIQVMSKQADNPELAAWAERRALVKALLKKQVEDPLSESEMPPDFVQQAIDAYAFNSGNPALVTASHILIRPDNSTTPEQRSQTLEKIRQALLAQDSISDEDLEREAVRLTHAGFRVDVNKDLTFPAHPIQPFPLARTESYKTVVQPFADAAFALSAQHPLSEVVESEFGHHLVLFKSRTEEKKADPVKDRDFIVKQIIESGRTMYAQQYLNQVLSQMMQDGKILSDETRLQELMQGGQQ